MAKNYKPPSGEGWGFKNGIRVFYEKGKVKPIGTEGLRWAGKATEFIGDSLQEAWRPFDEWGAARQADRHSYLKAVNETRRQAVKYIAQAQDRFYADNTWDPEYDIGGMYYDPNKSWKENRKTVSEGRELQKEREDDWWEEELDLMQKDIDWTKYNNQAITDTEFVVSSGDTTNLTPAQKVAKGASDHSLLNLNDRINGEGTNVIQTKSLAVANLKNTNEKVLGGKPDELAIKTELGKNLRATNLGGTDPGQSLWLGKNSTWSMGGNVVAPKVGTPEAEAMMNIPETPETPIAEEIVSDTPDPVEVDSGLGVEDTSQLVQQNVTVDPVTPAVPAAAPAAGTNPLPEGFFSGMIDWLNNRGGGK